MIETTQEQLRRIFDKLAFSESDRLGTPGFEYSGTVKGTPFGINAILQTETLAFPLNSLNMLFYKVNEIYTATMSIVAPREREGI